MMIYNSIINKKTGGQTNGMLSFSLFDLHEEFIIDKL